MITFDLKQHLKQKKDSLPKRVITLTPARKLTNTKWVFTNARPLGSSPLGMVYALPQDNMPCIKPDMSQHQTMPNLAKGNELTIDPRIQIGSTKPKKK